MNHNIYLDYASTTPVDPQVVSAMEPYWNDLFAHPWSHHSQGKEAHAVLEVARTAIGHALGISGVINEKRLVLTSGGTESNTLALRGILDGQENLSGKRIIISSIEHPSVGGIATYANKLGVEVDIVPVRADGRIDMDALKKKLTEDTVLVSCQYVNSEIGTIQPLEKIIKMVHSEASNAYVHTDASQAWAWMDIDVEKLGVDLLTVDAHKMYGPKGVGALYVKKDTPLTPLFLGSEGYRGGTPAVPLVVGFQMAVDIAQTTRKAYAPHVEELRDRIFSRIHEVFPQAVINGSKEHRVANNVSVSFPGTNHEFLQMRLDEAGFFVATRSACLEGGEEGSHVIAGLPGRSDKNALRITLGKETTLGEVEAFMDALDKLF